MGIFSKFFSKKEVEVKVVKKTELDIFLEKISHNIRLDSSYRNQIYGNILRRTETILFASGKDKAYVSALCVQLERMLNKRRGLSLPVGIDAQNIQRYREISTLVLVLIYLTKNIAVNCINRSIQVEHEGEIYTFPFYQDYLYGSFKVIGVVENNDAFNLTKDIEVSLRVSILNDLLMNSPLAYQWFGMFPDMKRVLYRSLQNIDDSSFSIISDEFINVLNKNIGSVSSSSDSNQTSNRSGTTQDLVAKKNDVNTNTESTVERKPLKSSPKLTELLLQTQGNNPLKRTTQKANSSSTVFNENARQEELKKKGDKISEQKFLSPSPGIAALLSKSKKNNTEDIANNCLRSLFSKSNFLNLASLISDDGEAVSGIYLAVEPNNLKGVFEKEIGSSESDFTFDEIIKHLKSTKVVIGNIRGSYIINSNIGGIYLLRVDKLTLQSDIDYESISNTSVDVDSKDVSTS